MQNRAPYWSLLAGSAFVCALLPGAAPADAMSLVASAQERSVQAASYGYVPDVWGCGAPELPPCNESVSASVSAPDFSPFDAAVTTPPCTFVGCPPGSASQRSSIELTAITARGDASGQSSHSYCCGGGSSEGSSVLEVSFRLDEPAAYEAAGVLSFAWEGSATDPAQAYAFWMLLGPGGVVDGCYSGVTTQVIGPFPFDNPCVGPVESSGELEPGDYALLIQAVAQPASTPSNFHQASAHYELSLRLIPEPATSLLVMTGLVGLAARRRT